MGRSEAPLPSDSNGEESLEEPTENYLTNTLSMMASAGDTWSVGVRLRGLYGVDSKSNEQDH